MPDDLMASDSKVLRNSATVRLHSLKKRDDLNGRQGMLIRYFEKRGRWAVEFEGEETPVMLLESNLESLLLRRCLGGRGDTTRWGGGDGGGCCGARRGRRCCQVGGRRKWRQPRLTWRRRRHG